MNKLSLVMIVKDEELVLERCLKSVEGLVDEIIIVDTGSTDQTIEIAKSFNASIYEFKWKNDFSEARNFALSKAKNEYRLILDADEYIISWDKEYVNQFLKTGQIGMITILDHFMQEGDNKQARSYLSRLIPKSAYYKGAIHEQVVSQLKRVRVPIEIEHDGYLYKDKSQRNLSVLFKCVEQSPTDKYILYQLAHTLFVSNHANNAYEYYKKYYKYSTNESYRCGAIVDYLYNIIAVGRLEEGLSIISREQEQYSDSPDFNFVCGHFFRELVLSDVNKYIQYLPRIEASFLRCLEIGETTKYDTVVGTGTYEAAYNLGAWYEVSGNLEKANEYYSQAQRWGYEKARVRLGVLNNQD